MILNLKFPLPLIACLIIFHTSAAQRFDFSFILDGKIREGILVKPSNAPPAGGYPLVVMLHSSSHDAEEPFNISGWNELGELENFVIVYPSSLKWCINEDSMERVTAKWVNGGLIEYPCTAPQQYVDDVRFLKYLVERVKDTLPINATKVFASGFSNGSSMIHKLAMDAGDVFAAVGGCGGSLFMSDSTLQPINRIPIWFMVGTEDPFFLYQNYTEVPFGEDSALIYFNKIISRVQACQGLKKDFTKNISPLTHTYQFNQAQAGQIAKPYLFTLIKGMKHMYPNGNNFPIEAARNFWEFFKQVSTDVTDPHIASTISIPAYPNPSNDQIWLDLQGLSLANPTEIVVFNKLGIQVWKAREILSDHCILEKANLGTGMFFVHLKSGNLNMIQKIIFN